MAEQVFDGKQSSRRMMVFPLILVAAYGVFNLLLNPIVATRGGPRHELLVPLLFAIVFAQPVLLAEWAVLGTGAAIQRVPLTIVATAVLALCGYSTEWNMLKGNRIISSNELGIYLCIWAIVFPVSAAILIVARRFTGWRILPLSSASQSSTFVNQFSIRYLLVLTALCAMVLGLARLLAAQHLEGIIRVNLSEVGHILLGMGLVMLAILPTFIVPLVALIPRPTIQIWISVPLAWAVLTWLALQTVMATGPGQDRLRIIRDIALLQTGAVLAGLLSALVVRYAGYRLVSLKALDPAPPNSISE